MSHRQTVIVAKYETYHQHKAKLRVQVLDFPQKTNALAKPVTYASFANQESSLLCCRDGR